MIKISPNITRTPLVGILLVLICVVIAYFPILDGPFKVVYDSDHIVKNALLNGSPDIIKILFNNMFRADAPYRPMTLVSHLAEGYFFKLIPVYYYLVNILLHAGCALLVYAAVTLISKDKILGLLTALIFAVHPAHWEAVSFLSGRAVLLNTFFTLAALTACMLYVRRLNGWWMFLSLTGFIFSLLSHESYGPTIVLFIFYIFFMIRNQQPKEMRWLILLPYAVVSGLFILIRHGLSGYQLALSGDGINWLLRLMGALRSLLLEALVLIAPFQIYFHQSANPLKGFSDPMAIAAVMLIITGIVFLLIKRSASKDVILFLAVWFICASWPLLNNAFLLGTGAGRLLMDGTMLYMSSIAFIALLIMGVRGGLHKIQKQNYVGTSLFVIVMTVFLVVTFRQNILSTHEIAIFKKAVKHEPASPIFEYDLAIIYEEQDLNSESQAHFERAVQLDPNFTSARMGLGKVLYEQGKFLDAAKAYEAINNPGRYETILRNNLRGIYNVLVMNQETILRGDPQNINAHFSLGIFYEKLGDLNRAIASFEQVMVLDPNNTSGLKGIALRFQGLLYQRLGLIDKAKENFALAR